MSNGKGDKWRGGWSPQYEENHNKIFGEFEFEYFGGSDVVNKLISFSQLVLLSLHIS